MSKLDACYSKNSDEWETPDAFFAELHREFRFTRDVAASHENAKCRKYYCKDDDALSLPWIGRCWCNPPYSQIAAWCKKAFEERQRAHCECIVMLVPSRTDTRYWHDYVLRAESVRFVKGRLKFKGGKSCAPFPSAIIIW